MCVCLHQDLTEADFENWLEFYNSALIKANKDKYFLNKVTWTDEAKFCCDGTVNQNHQWLREHNHQFRWSFNVRCGISGNKIIESYFLEGNLTGRQYTVDVLNELVDDFACDLPLQDLRQTWFQHNGAIPHLFCMALEVGLKTTFQIGISDEQDQSFVLPDRRI